MPAGKKKGNDTPENNRLTPTGGQKGQSLPLLGNWLPITDTQGAGGRAGTSFPLAARPGAFNTSSFVEAKQLGPALQAGTQAAMLILRD